MNDNQLRHKVEVVAYDPNWATRYQEESELLLNATGESFVEMEHIGSTAIPNQRAKPVIDMMVAVQSLDELEGFLPALNNLGYKLIETDMPERHFLRKQGENGPAFHLHIVECSTWDERNERLLRDYLLEHPGAVEAYSALKDELALAHADDSLEYTKAKTAFIQGVMDRARDDLGLPRVNVWDD